MKRIQFFVAVVLLLFAVNEAGALGLGISGRASTLGFGPEAIIGVTSNLNFRVGLNNYSFNNIYGSETDYEYFANLHLKTMSALIDWYPFRGKFRLSTGLVQNNNLGEITVSPTESYQIGGRTYDPEDIGSLQGEVSFNKHVPYIGFGLGNPVDKNFRLGFMLDIGMIYQNSPKVNFTADGMIAPTAEQDKDVEEKLSGWKAYGVFSLGLSIRLL